MRALLDMDTIQIEITNACVNSCSNCTRFCGHQEPYFMSFDQFKTAVDSMIGYPKMTGIMGGEPLLHPEFEKFCDYALSKIPAAQLGLWTGFPKGKEKYRDCICRTFGNIFLNDHGRPDIFHAPVLVAAEEAILNKDEMWYVIDHCWLQNGWSAAINPRGAFFCEIAAAMSILFEGNSGWKPEPRWWMRIPKDFREQMEEYCPKCGAALTLERRPSIDGRDDISPENLQRLKGKSQKIARGKYIVSEMKPVAKPREMAAYKDENFRARIADRYGIFLVLNEKQFWTPFLKKKFSAVAERKSLFDIYKAE